MEESKRGVDLVYKQGQVFMTPNPQKQKFVKIRKVTPI